LADLEFTSVEEIFQLETSWIIPNNYSFVITVPTTCKQIVKSLTQLMNK